MFIATFPVGPFQCNCTILADPASGETVVIDPGDEAGRILREIAARGFKVKYLAHTHAHLDHVGATRAVHGALGGEVCLHRGDQFLYDNIAMQGEFLGISVDPETAPVSRYIEHGDVLEAGAMRFEVLHTPGHTPGSACFALRAFPTDEGPVNLLFSGDTLFRDSIGRTDLWGGDFGQIKASIRERLYVLPPETLVIPGHGPQTSIGHEKRHNPFVS